MSTTTTHENTSTYSKPKLQGKVAIITGAASGIGETTARLFADHGTSMVVIADIQDELGHKVSQSIGVSKCTYVHCDVTDEEQVKSTVEWTVHKYHRLDIMFCNAGICSRPPQTVLELDLSVFDRVFAVNARGVAACVKHAARVMVERRVRGSIVCMGSIVAVRGRRRCTDYCMSKHAVLGSASLQLGEHGVRVNCVSPSTLATPLTCTANDMEAAEVERENERFSCLKGVVLKRKHVADAVLFLGSDESEFITGHNLEVDGGLVD